MLGREELLVRAQRLNERHAILHRTVPIAQGHRGLPLRSKKRSRGESERVRISHARNFWAAYRDFHDPVDDIPNQMDAGDLEAIEAGIVYLEVSPRCFRSGYLAERMMRHLSRATLTPAQHARCIEIVMREPSRRTTRPWRYVAALAGAVWSDALQQELNTAANGGEWSEEEVRMLVAMVRSWRGNRRLTTDVSTLQASLREHPERWQPWWQHTDR